ncbi:MAG: porin, partial [Chromatocurvus sp.]
WLGRGKALYNMEFWLSSGRQQFVERNISNALFTLNRQQGAQLYGRLFRDTPADLNYALGAFTGRGGAEGSNDDDHLMLTSRLQWNALGGDIEDAHGDLAFSPSPRLNLAVAGMRNRSDCTRFGSGAEGCRALPRFLSPADAEDGQFEVEQAMAELRLRWNGFSMDGEVHRKEVTDRLRDNGDPQRRTTLEGGFIQAGLLPHGLFPALPPQLEFALRYASVRYVSVDQDDFRGSDELEEVSGVANWYIDGHNNKLSVEFSRIDLENPLLQADGTENRLRLQWDVRF